MEKWFWTAREVELIKRELEMDKRTEIAAHDVHETQALTALRCENDKRIAEKNSEITALTEINKHAVKVAEQAIREEFQKRILELTEKASIAEARIKEAEAQKSALVTAKDKEIERIAHENLEMRITLTAIAKEKAVVVTPNVSPAHMVVVQDGKQIEIVK